MSDHLMHKIKAIGKEDKKCHTYSIIHLKIVYAYESLIWIMADIKQNCQLLNFCTYQELYRHFVFWTWFELRPAFGAITWPSMMLQHIAVFGSWSSQISDSSSCESKICCNDCFQNCYAVFWCRISTDKVVFSLETHHVKDYLTFGLLAKT